MLGLLVDGDCVRLTRSYRSKIETHIRGIALFGLAEHAAARRFSSTWGLVRHIFGLIAHAQAVEPVYGRMMKQEFKLVLTQLGWMTAPARAGPSDISGIADITSP